MTRYSFLNKIAIICIIIFVSACNSDATINDPLVEDGVLEKLNLPIDAPNTMEMVIVYKTNTGRNTKEKIRKPYINEKILISVVECGLYNAETWIINEDLYQKRKPKVNPKSDNEPVERVYIYRNCENYKEN